ncbi:Brp/Blh family beta-carotene 15,15'-dioxygenase [Salinibacter sp.]|uniref:Brp/Blh family beta-carotene 15,15'-dioxygenase n=1 Tax=Salinibacter sp. TaxID=2065818 RepID=UPI0021E7B0EA|nr:Brp/Blh family beta-carotene 15,15'-dioxygenase [Salinibacter sp.]
MHNPVTLRSPRIYGGVLVLTVLAIVLGTWGGVSLGPWALGVLFVAVVLTGMPHGAVDHLVAARLWGLGPTWADQAKFYGGYLVLMALYGALWIGAPAWSLGLFLVMTMYHFGQADLAYWRLPPLSARLLYLSRGLFLLGLPIVAFPEVVAPIFEAMGGVQLLTWPGVTTAPGALFAGLVAQHLGALGIGRLGADPSVDWALGREATNVAVLAALFGLVHPLVAFAVFFGGWHALGHILELLRFFRRQGDAMSMARFYREAFLFTAIPFVGLAGLYAATQSFGLEDQMVALLFILIAIMTLPHMVVVEKMYREREKGAPQAAA